jgi:hypothetical protein
MLLATALAAAVAIAAGSVAGAAHVQVTSQVDAHWRGSYDILVRPPSSRLDLEKTGGLVEPNFLGFTGAGGITLDQLAGIRGLADVALAAPATFIGYVTESASAPTIHITKLPSTPTLYQVELTIASSDGLGQKLIYRQQVRVLLGPPTTPGGEPLAVSDYGSNKSSGRLPDGTYTIDISGDTMLPGITSPVLAVDPVAEQQLLGSTGGTLAPLVNLAGQPLTAKTFDPRLIPDPYWQTSAILGLLATKPSTADRPVFPILVADRVDSPLTLTLDVMQVGAPITGSLDDTAAPGALLDRAAAMAGSGTTPAGQTSTDLTGQLRPLAPTGLVAPWLGSTSAEASNMFRFPTEFRSALSGRPGYATVTPPAGRTGPTFRIEPAGVVGIGGKAGIGSGVTTVATGTEQTYRTLEPVDNPLLKGFIRAADYDRPFVFAPTGTFDMSALAPPSDPLTYVPLGAYDPPDTTLVADPSGAPVTPRAMTPTLNPTGLLQVPPLAIADLRAAVAFRGRAPLDAIRVRVAGLSGFDEGAKAKVERVASAIAAMGLDVDIVAGSSPQAVNIYVPVYDTATVPPSDLGWVQQHWTTLGAATRVVHGLGDTNVALLALATLSLVVVIVGLEVLFAATRRRDAAVLAAVGWSRGARVRWQVSEALTAGVLVTAVGLVAWTALGRSPAALAVVAGIGAAFPLAAVAAALLMPVTAGTVVGTGRGGGLLRRVPVDGLTAFSLRSLAARPLRSVVTILALGTAAATTGPALALVATVGLRVGPTRLAGAVGAQLAPFQLALLGLAAAGSIGFCIVAIRASVADREDEFLALAASGWQPAQLRGVLRRERASIALPAALFAGTLAFVVATPVTEAAPLVSATIAAGLALSMVAWGGLVARPALLRGAYARRSTSARRRGRTR